MKQIKNKRTQIFSGIVFIFLLTSCEILDVEPTTQVPFDEAIRTKSDVASAINGCYSIMESNGYYGHDLVIIGDLASHNISVSGPAQEYDKIGNNIQTASNFVIERIWTRIYTAVNRVNTVLYYLPSVNGMTEEEKITAEAELRFLRALHYFNLVRLFGAVPYHETATLDAGTSLHKSRMAAVTVYQKIIEDLVFAGQYDLNNAYGRACKYAAKALLSKVYLTLHRNVEAMDIATEVIESHEFSLSPSYEELLGNNGRGEIIFSLDFNEQDGNTLARAFAPKIEGGNKDFMPVNSLTNLYFNNDLRKFTLFRADGTGFKYRNLETGSDDVMILRLAEMYLVRAEAEANLPTPNLSAIQDDLNRIRLRAGLDSILINNSSDALNEILLQRRLEFALEGHWWFDLVRTGRATATLGIDANHTLFPIPQIEINANDSIDNNDQNPGY